MVRIFQVIDSNGNQIPLSHIKMIDSKTGMDSVGNSVENIKIYLKDDFEVFSDDEIHLMIQAISEEVNCGVIVPVARQYLEIIDKLEKIRERKHDKSTT